MSFYKSSSTDSIERERRGEAGGGDWEGWRETSPRGVYQAGQPTQTGVQPSKSHCQAHLLVLVPKLPPSFHKLLMLPSSRFHNDSMVNYEGGKGRIEVQRHTSGWGSTLLVNFDTC